MCYSNLFRLCNWRRNLHIWSPNSTSTLALHKLHKWLCFGYAIATSILTWPPCSKDTWACLWYGRIKSCNSGAGFGANIGSEHSQNSLQLGENVWVEEASVWNFFRRRLSVSLQRLCYCDEKEESSIPEISPSLSRSLSVFSSFEDEERQRTCSLHHLQIRLSWRSTFDCKQPVESMSYKEFKATGKFFSSFRSVSFSLSPPFSLSLVLMQQTYSFSALVNIDSTSL